MAISPSGPVTATDIRTDYMHLLITQLQNQNPLEPMSNDQMASQLAQLSQLEQLEHQSTTFDKVLLAQETAQATALIGKQVSFFPSGSDELVTDEVEGVELVDGQVMLLAGGEQVALGDVVAITDQPGEGSAGEVE